MHKLVKNMDLTMIPQRIKYIPYKNKFSDIIPPKLIYFNAIIRLNKLIYSGIFNHFVKQGFSGIILCGNFFVRGKGGSVYLPQTKIQIRREIWRALLLDIGAGPVVALYVFIAVFIAENLVALDEIVEILICYNKHNIAKLYFRKKSV